MENLLGFRRILEKLLRKNHSSQIRLRQNKLRPTDQRCLDGGPAAKLPYIIHIFFETRHHRLDDFRLARKVAVQRRLCHADGRAQVPYRQMLNALLRNQFQSGIDDFRLARRQCLGLVHFRLHVMLVNVNLL